MLRRSDEYEALTEGIIGCAIKVHEYYGPGLLESIYTKAFVIELREAGYSVEVGRHVPMEYRGRRLGIDCVIDIVVNGVVVVELKAVERILQVYRAQTITYLKLTGCPVGLLINFNVPVLRDGLHRLVHPDRYARSKAAESAVSKTLS